MQVFVLGKTKSGKSTLAEVIKTQGFIVYEAGAWARREFEEQHPQQEFEEMSPLFKEQLTAFAQAKLKQNPYYSLEQYEQFRQQGWPDVAVVGVRNPDDFIHMLRSSEQNKVIIIQSEQKYEGTVASFETGVDVIMAYLKWRTCNGNPIPSLIVEEGSCENSALVEVFLKE